MSDELYGIEMFIAAVTAIVGLSLYKPVIFSPDYLVLEAVIIVVGTTAILSL